MLWCILLLNLKVVGFLRGEMENSEPEWAHAVTPKLISFNHSIDQEISFGGHDISKM